MNCVTPEKVSVATLLPPAVVVASRSFGEQKRTDCVVLDGFSDTLTVTVDVSDAVPPEASRIVTVNSWQVFGVVVRNSGSRSI